MGTTSSSSFIATVGSHQATYGGVRDGFLAKFNSAGVRQWSTYYGGPSLDNAYSCATDADGNIYIAGDAEFSPGTTIATSGAHQSVNGGDDDAFLVQFNSSGVRQWGTYYGGTGTDRGYSCATDANGDVYLVGMTNSSTGIATIGAHQQIYAGSIEAFLVKFNTFGTRLSGTYYGSADIDIANECTVDTMGNIYLAGQTWSYTNSGIATAGAHQTINNGGAIAFLAKFDKCTDPTTAIVNQSACDSYTWALNGTTYTSSGTYTHVATNANGCEVTTTLNLIINNSTTATINQTACDSYTWALNGTTYTSSGNYTYIGTNANGCPLTTTLNLTINNSTTASVTQTACDSYAWALNGTTYTSSGTYTHVGTNAAGCPLTTTLNLTINNSTTASVTQTACDAYTWALNGTTYTSSGTYTHVGTNAAGCLLTTTLNLTINNSTTASVTQTACDSYTWALNGATYTSSGTYTHVGTNAAGCQLTTTLNLTINNSTTATVTQTACDSYTWALNGSSYTSSGTYTHLGTNAAGCPLTTTLNLTINNSTSTTVNQTACDSYTWALNGTTYTSSGTYTHLGINAAGCPLTTTLNLIINNSTAATVNQTACDAYTWALNGTTYTSSGTYTHLGTNAAGCSLTTTLNLIINNSTTATVNQTACDAYTWALNGTTYTSSGTYTHVGTNAAGCPLTTTLNLIINNSTTATVNETACDTYTWLLNGMTYTTSGVYTHVATNSAGCDFTTTLNLTINNSTIDTTIESACETYSWALNGTTYTTSGIYTYSGTNANGCALSSTLILTIDDSITVSVAETACDNYLWNLNGTNYNTTGIYTHVSISPTGCFLATTLNLTINNSTTATVNETACDTYTWALNGFPYSTSGTYIYDSINAAGCPLTTTLNLTINNSTNTTVTETACNTYTWGLNGSNYSTSGTYTYLDTNAAGCPQTNTLNLVISTIDTSAIFNGATITANAVGATYQWIDCDNGNAPIAGATSQSFMPVSNGNYAVIISDANCIDTSACYNVNTVGFGNLESYNLTVYPNPTSGNVQINLGKAYQNSSIKLINLLGETINHKTYTSTNEITFEIEGASGVYFLEIESIEQVLVRIRVIKN